MKKENDEMNRKILNFLALTFLITGAGWGSLYLLVRSGQLSFGDPGAMILFALAGFGPTFATFITIVLTDGKSGFRALWNRLFRFKVSGWYYLAAFLILAVIGLVPALVESELDTLLSILSQTSWGIVPVLFLSSFFFGGLEEIGWRGYLQHELQKKFNIWVIYPITAVIWAFWHLPLFYIPGVSQFGQNFWIFSLYAFIFTLFLGWLYGRTKSIPIAILGHTLINTFSAIRFLNFIDKDSVHWVTILILLAGLAGLNFLFPVKKFQQT